MKLPVTVVLTLLSIIAMVAGAQSSTGSSVPEAAPQVRPALPKQQLPESKVQDSASREKAEADETRRVAQAREEAKLAREALARGYWVDPSTGLMWAAKDNGKDVTWRQAMKYCRELRLAGYSNWRLAMIDELQGIYDGSASVTLPSGKGMEYIIAGRPKGGLFLTSSLYWSSNRVIDDRGHPNGYAWQFGFFGGRRQHEPLGYFSGKRALCVAGGASPMGRK